MCVCVCVCDGGSSAGVCTMHRSFVVCLGTNFPLQNTVIPPISANKLFIQELLVQIFGVKICYHGLTINVLHTSHAYLCIDLVLVRLDSLGYNCKHD